MQLDLNFESAEAEAKASGVGIRAGRRRRARVRAPPLSKAKVQDAVTATVEEVVVRLERAFVSVAANKGAAGPDRQSIAMVREHLPQVLPTRRST